MKGGDRMPARDGTGPVGMGPMTGRGFGVGAGMSPGYGCRRGIAGMYNSPISKEAEKELLTQQVEFLKRQIENLDK